MRKVITYLFLILLLASCEEQSDWNLQKATNDLIVVDGIITNEFKTQTITLSRPVAQLNEEAEPVSGATILVSSNQVSYTFHEDPLQPGRYLSDQAFTGIKNRTYSLLVTSGNRVFSSKAILEPPAATFAFIAYQKKPADNKFFFKRLQVSYNPVNPAMYEILLDWSTAPGYTNQNPDSCKAKVYYYTLPTIDVSEVLAPAMEEVTFPSGTIVTERRYSLSREHAAFIRAILLETTWKGGYFNTASANVPTNMSTGALGFFGACGVTEKVEVAK